METMIGNGRGKEGGISGCRTVRGTVLQANVLNGVSRATNGESTSTPYRTCFKISPAKSNSRESNPHFRRLFDLLEEITAIIRIFRGPKPPVKIGSI